MQIRHVKVSIILILTLLLIMPIINLPTTVNADPGILYVPTPAYPTISAAITAAIPGDTIIVAAGTYLETLEISKQLNITGVGAVIVQGGAMFATHYGNRQATIFVHDATNVVLNGLDVEGSGLGVPAGTKSYAVLYENAQGTVQGCTVSPNTIGDLNAVGIAAWDGSNLAVRDCIVKNFGRIGIFSNAATMDIERNTIIGQPYTGSGQVNYGIEIEDYTGASTAYITDNEIYNCGAGTLPTWSSAAILVDIWRYYNAGSKVPSTVHIEGNHIHDNFLAIEIVGNAGGIVGYQYAHYNNIHDNLYGVWTDPDELGNNTYFDAQYNWWGNPAGPTGNDCDPIYVIYANWLTGPYAERLYIDPPEVNKTPADVNSFFEVYVTLENFVDLAGFDIKLTWDNSRINKTSDDHTTYLDALWGVGKWSDFFEDSGAGYYKLAAAALATSASNTGASVLFKLTFKVMKSCNFPLSTTIGFTVVKLSDNAEPIPNPIVPGTVTGCLYTMTNTMPDLEIVVVGEYHAPPFEYCDYFWLEVYVTHICVNSPLTDYHLTIEYGTHLADFTGVVEWGPVCNPGTQSETTPGQVVVEGLGGGWSGDRGLLFKLKFHVEFANIEEHVWKFGNANYETFNIAIIDATLSFATGTIPMSGIIMPAPVTMRVNFIRGDVDCNGVGNMNDIGNAAFHYDKTSADPTWISTIRRYDLNNDNIIDIYDIVAIATNYGYGNPHH